MGINRKKLIERICQNSPSTLEPSGLPQRWLQIIHLIDGSRYLSINSRAGLAPFLLRVNKTCDLLEASLMINGQEHLYAHGLLKVFERHKQWRQPLTTWQPTSHNKRKQFDSILKHVFGPYELPAFMLHVWFRDDPGSYRYRDWYVNLVRGQSMRKQKSKLKITRKVAHFFGTAPDHYSVEQALWWGIIHSKGGNHRIASEFNAARPSCLIEAQPFWERFIQFVVENPMLDRHQIGPIIDYINFQKFDTHETTENNQVVENPPPQPNFSLTNRNPDVLLQQVNAWHKQTSRLDSSVLIPFPAAKIKPFNTGLYTIKQLVNNHELMREGEEMSHCVGSYLNSCQAGDCSIWSLSRLDPGGEKKLITIEVDPEYGILQARGRYNALASESEMNLIKQWAKQENLYVSEWLDGYD